MKEGIFLLFFSEVDACECGEIVVEHLFIFILENDVVDMVPPQFPEPAHDL